MTLQAPLTYQNVHVRGGYIVPIQQAGNTTKTSRLNPWSLVVALDDKGEAAGELYLDDGVSIVPSATKDVQLQFSTGTLQTTVSGGYVDGLALGNVSIAGLQSRPSGVSLTLNGQKQDTGAVQLEYSNGTLYVSNLEGATAEGVWSGNMVLSLVYGGASTSASASTSAGWRGWSRYRA